MSSNTLHELDPNIKPVPETPAPQTEPNDPNTEYSGEGDEGDGEQDPPGDINPPKPPIIP